MIGKYSPRQCYSNEEFKNFHFKKKILYDYKGLAKRKLCEFQHLEKNRKPFNSREEIFIFGSLTLSGKTNGSLQKSVIFHLRFISGEKYAKISIIKTIANMRSDVSD